MEDNFRLIKLLLDLHDAVCLGGILVLDDVFLKSRQRTSILAESRIRERGPRVLGKEFIHNLAKKLVGDQGRIVTIGDDDTGNTLCATIGVECVGLLLNILSLSGLCLLCDGSVEEHQEFIVAGGVVGLVTCTFRTE